MGAFGLMLNRPTGIAVSKALNELHGAATHSEPILFGGPVELDTVFALSRSPHQPDGAKPVFGKIYLMSAKADLEKGLADPPNPGQFRVYIGYCGWGPRQLQNEVTRGGWFIFDRNEERVFDGEPSTLWTRLIAKAEAEVARAMRPMDRMSP